ncbi:MAG: hypothetical protein RL518_1361 [Pseudomonadota bacterium]|jgi:hypothetical protein
MKRTWIATFTALTACVFVDTNISNAAPRPCRFGFKGVYVTWNKNSSAAGTGTFEPSSNRASVVPDFTWEVTGKPRSVTIGTDEPFSGGNSMKGFYGQADDATNLNVRIQSNNTPARQPIPHSAVLTLRFNSSTPASGWGFAVVDIDVDQVRLSATDRNGNPVSSTVISRWFAQSFDANPSVNGVNIPSWNASDSAVVGASSRSESFRETVEGDLDDTEAASAWFQPRTSLSTLTFEYQSLQEYATPSYHVLLAACETNYIAATPTPNATPSGDSDGDSIPDSTEGVDDNDDDQRPNYLDRDSDGDSIPDGTEGTGDPDGDGIPNYEDEDSDGDNVPDRIEGDPDAPGSVPSQTDDDGDGMDDGDNGRIITPSDTDTDGNPDVTDSDSDNDGKRDGDEAFDLDGDGFSDIPPSGEDTNENGVDDAYDGKVSTDQVNKDYIGADAPPLCTSSNLTGVKKTVRSRLSALAARVPSFGRRAVACGGTQVSGLVARASSDRRAFERELDASFQSKELVCPTTVCPNVSKASSKTKLNALASRLFTHAKRSKLNAIKACKPQRNGGNDPRPQTEDYLSALRRAIADLPASVSECEQ